MTCPNPLYLETASFDILDEEEQIFHLHESYLSFSSCKWDFDMLYLGSRRWYLAIIMMEDRISYFILFINEGHLSLIKKLSDRKEKGTKKS